MQTSCARARWLASPLGRQVLEGEARLLRGLLDEVVGLELVQLGDWGASRELLSASRTRSQTIVAEVQECAPDLVARLDQLPVQGASVDAVLLPHTLEFADDPQAVVREADRILTGEGQFIALGFRPVGPWGLRSLASREGYPPGLRQLLGAGRVQDWLRLLGYEVVVHRHYLYSRPWGTSPDKSRRILRRGLFNPLPASAWLLRARKRVRRMTPLRLRFLRERRSMIGATTPAPTARNHP